MQRWQEVLDTQGPVSQVHKVAERPCSKTRGKGKAHHLSKGVLWPPQAYDGMCKTVPPHMNTPPPSLCLCLFPHLFTPRSWTKKERNAEWFPVEHRRPPAFAPTAPLRPQAGPVAHSLLTRSWHTFFFFSFLRQGLTPLPWMDSVDECSLAFREICPPLSPGCWD